MVHDTSGKIIGEWGRRKLSEIEKEKPTKRRNVHISRQALRAKLLVGLDNDIKWGHLLKNVSHSSKSQIELEFQVGGTKQLAQADLVVGADGIRSSVRSLLIREDTSPLRYLGCIVILGICPLNALANIKSPLLD